MARIMILLGASVGGAIGWWAGAHFGIVAAFVLSLIGTAAGVYFARRWLAGLC